MLLALTVYILLPGLLDKYPLHFGGESTADPDYAGQKNTPLHASNDVQGITDDQPSCGGKTPESGGLTETIQGCPGNTQCLQALDTRTDTNSIRQAIMAEPPTTTPPQDTPPGQKTVKLVYVLNGREGNIDFTVYQSLNQYGAPSRFYGRTSQRDMQIAVMDNPLSSKEMDRLIDGIRAQTDIPGDQARIAISLVQQIPYDHGSILSGNLKNRCPYQVVYDQIGACGEKAKLLAYLLRGLGYKVALFRWGNTHEAVGLGCPISQQWAATGYCFIEAAKAVIPTDKPNMYGIAGDTELGDDPEVIPISAGNILDLYEEKMNADEYRSLQKSLQKNIGLPAGQYNRYVELAQKYGIKIDTPNT